MCVSRVFAPQYVDIAVFLPFRRVAVIRLRSRDEIDRVIAVPRRAAYV